MKKGFWTSLIAAFALCFALAACGGGKVAAIDKSGFIGVWELSGMVSDGEETAGEDLDTVKAFGLNVFVVLSEDGTGTLNLFGEELKGTWDVTTPTEGSLAFTDEDGEESSAPMTIDGDKLIMSQDGDTLTFTKSTQEAMDEFLANGSSLSDALSDALGDDDESLTEEIADEVKEEESSTAAVSGKIDNEYISLTFAGMHYDSDGDLNVEFTATNKTDHDIVLFSGEGDWSVNGKEPSNSTVYTSISAGETTDDYLFVSGVEGEDLNNLKLKGSIEIDDENWDELTTVDFTL